MRFLTVTQILAASAALLVAGAAGAQDVGVTAAVNPATTGTPPGQPSRTLTQGGPITFLEEIETNDDGQTQVLFLDQSTLTVGPNSYVVIDEFVFDPAQASGSLTLSLEEGLVRYVGGQISKEGGVAIDTQVATIGIRGGMAIVERLSTTKAKAINLFGRVTINPRGEGAEPYVLDDPSEFAVVEESGITEVGEITSAELSALYKQFEGGSQTRILNAVIEAQIAKNTGAEPSAEIQEAKATPANSPPAPYEVLVNTEESLSQTVALGLQQEQISNTPPANGEITNGDNGGAVGGGGGNGGNGDNGGGNGGGGNLTTLSGYASGVGFSLRGEEFLDEVYLLETTSTTSGNGAAQSGNGFTFERDPTNNTIAVTLDTVAAPLLTEGDAPQEARWAFGDIGGTNSLFVDEGLFSASESFSDRGQGFDGEVNRNDVGEDGNNRFGFRSFFVTQTVPLDFDGLPDQALCECPFLQYGFWGGTYAYDPQGPNAGRIETVPLGTWVAGEKPSAEMIAGLSGTATHSGIAFGTVVERSGAARFAAGAYEQTFDFGTDIGTFAITQFDGRNFTGGDLGVARNGHPADFVSTRSARSEDGFRAHVVGSFFMGGGDPIRQAGGNFRIDDNGGGNYSASGSFVADKNRK